MRIELLSSHGEIVADLNGMVMHDESDYDKDSYLAEIQQVDIIEVRDFMEGMGVSNFKECMKFDILDLGYWKHNGDYVSADEDFRKRSYEDFIN